MTIFARLFLGSTRKVAAFGFLFSLMTLAGCSAEGGRKEPDATFGLHVLSSAVVNTLEQLFQ